MGKAEMAESLLSLSRWSFESRMFNIQRLELARKRCRLSAKSLADKAGIAPVTYSRIVNGKQIADDKTIDALSAALEYPRDFFFQDDIEHQSIWYYYK